MRSADIAPASVVTPALLPRPFRVRAVRHETVDTVSLSLEPLDDVVLDFTPGQFTMIGMPGYGEVPISISGDPTDPAVLMQTIRAVGDATRALVRALPGDVVLVRGPFGRGWLPQRAAAGDVVIAAGGIGLAPLRPLILDVLARRSEYQRVVLLYGSRSPDELLFLDEVHSWRARLDIDVFVTVDAAPAGWRGRVGLITSLLPAVDCDPLSASVFVCGPELMMRLVADAAVAAGVSAERVQISMERNMKCGVGLCGHCQLREFFVCTDGPVFGYDVVGPLLATREL